MIKIVVEIQTSYINCNLSAVSTSIKGGMQGKGGKMDLIILTIPYHTYAVISFLCNTLHLSCTYIL